MGRLMAAKPGAPGSAWVSCDRCGRHAALSHATDTRWVYRCPHQHVMVWSEVQVVA